MNISTLARETLGYESLRPGQREAVTALLNGRDTLAILPTGAGKSAIYQLAGLELPGPVIIASPLLALQKDQREAIEASGIGTAANLNSGQSETERAATLEKLVGGEIKYLFLAPEQLTHPEITAQLAEAKPSLFVVDEAHCVSQWGHDFRPDYLRLAPAIEAVGRPTILALTATAAPPVRDEIMERLNLHDPELVVTGFDRPNLFLEVRQFRSETEKRNALIEAVVAGPRPAIVYCPTRASTEEIAAALKERGICTCAYHAGLSKPERNLRQNAFMSGDCSVIVATVAFGLGVDKPDVRRVWHYAASDSLDSYYQEAGRAGRDGQDAQAVLFYLQADLNAKRFHTSGRLSDSRTAAALAATVAHLAGDGTVDLDTLKEETGLPARQLTRALTQLEDTGELELGTDGSVSLCADLDVSRIAEQVDTRREKHKQWEQSRLEMMRLYAEETGCRRQFLLAYFGEHLPTACGNCDNCCRNHAKLALAPVMDDDHPFPIGTRVRHASWSEGQVLRYDEDKIVIVFDEAGYKTLAMTVVTRNHLLEAVG